MIPTFLNLKYFAFTVLSVGNIKIKGIHVKSFSPFLLSQMYFSGGVHIVYLSKGLFFTFNILPFIDYVNKYSPAM